MYLFILILTIVSGVALIGFSMFYKPDFFLRKIVTLPVFQVSPALKNGGRADANGALCAQRSPSGQHKRRTLRLTLMLAASVAVAIWLAAFFAASFWPPPPHAQDIEYSGNARLALSKETLIPPPPLPPSIFIGVERGNLETADRDWNKLEPVFRQRLLMVFARMEARGYALALVEGYRTPDRQDRLANAEQKLTNARAFHSLHQYGLAADVAPIRNRRLAFDLADEWTKAAYFALGEEVAANNLAWGGAWSLQDYGHVQAKNGKYNN